ncbi:MAG: DUF1573 domain-containing protein [Bacteroidia bacterium]|nr:DUF1573 domain-containing protein [Bacteroidia bacterium]
MKKLILLLALPLFVAFHANAQTVPPPPPPPPVNPNAPVAKWDKTVNDFGDIAYNIPKTAEFTVTNTGKEPLIISSVQTSCGCTNPKWTPEPVLPGKSTIVSATFNAASQGAFNKTVTVRTNADTNPVYLFIKGNVLPAPAPAPAPTAAAAPTTK